MQKWLTELHEVWQRLHCPMADLVGRLGQHGTQSIQHCGTTSAGAAAVGAAWAQLPGAVRSCRVQVGAAEAHDMLGNSSVQA